MVNTQILFPMVDNQEHQSRSIINGHHQRSPGVRGTGGRLWINLKIPKEEQVKEDHNYDQHILGFEEEDKVRICHVCKKRFSSGKALGGHMRIHVQPANKKSKRPNQPIAWYKKRKLENIQEEEKETVEVDIPKKRKKAKIYDDNNMTSFHHKDSAATASVDLCKTVGGWSVTAKRGRSRNKPIIHDYSSEEEQQLHDAVHYLMLLAYGDHSLESRGLTGSAHKTGIKKRTIEETQLKCEGINNICQMKRIKRRGRKMMKLKDLGSIQDAHQNTVLFSTHQKYNKFNNIAIQNSVEETDQEEAARCSKLLVGSTNECKNISTTSSQVSSIIRNISGPRIMDFDLNELPLPEDDHLNELPLPEDDHEDAAGNGGCVSYSSDYFSQL